MKRPLLVGEYSYLLEGGSDYISVVRPWVHARLVGGRIYQFFARLLGLPLLRRVRHEARTMTGLRPGKYFVVVRRGRYRALRSLDDVRRRDMYLGSCEVRMQP